MDRRFSFDQFPDNVSLYTLTRAWIRSFTGADAPSSEPSAAVMRASKVRILKSLFCEATVCNFQIPGATTKLPTPEKGSRSIIEPPLKVPSKYPLDFSNLSVVRNEIPQCFVNSQPISSTAWRPCSEYHTFEAWTYRSMARAAWKIQSFGCQEWAQISKFICFAQTAIPWSPPRWLLTLLPILLQMLSMLICGIRISFRAHCNLFINV